MRNLTKLALLSSAAILSAGAAQAQTPTHEVGLEEIVVTAQRRAENLQDVPIAVSAVTAATATKLGITEPVAVAQIVPGFQFSRQSQTATPFLRGVGSSSGFVGNEPSVASFVDEVYVPSGAGAMFDYNNIDAIEVLKGPQGTLFGRNATGGVIHVRTRTPSRTFTADAALGYANYDTYSVQAYVSGPLSEIVSANLAVQSQDQRKGWGRNLLNGKDLYDGRSQGVNGKILIEPSDTTSIQFAGYYDRRESTQGIAHRVVPGAFSLRGFSPDQAGAGFYDAVINNDEGYDMNYYRVSAKVRQELERASIVSITAFGRLSSRPSFDSDTTPVLQTWSNGAAGQKTFTQELQVLSTPDSPISWIIGGFYLFDKAYYTNNFTGLSFPTGSAPLVYQVTDSISGFAQATAEIMPRTRMTIGLRYTTDKRRFNGTLRQPPAVIGPFKDSTTFNSLTGRFALDYKVSDDVMVYAAYNRGFKSGVYNLPGLNARSTAAPPPVLPEDLNAYSAGFKSEFWNKRARLNAEAYFYDFKNIQVSNIVAGATVLTNAGAAHIKGIDVDFTVVPVDRLTLIAALAITHGRYKSFPNGPTFFPQPPNPPLPIPAGCAFTAYPVSTTAPSVQGACELKGNKTIQTPPVSFNLSALYTIPTSVGDFDLSVSYAHGGNFYWEADNDALSKQAKTDIVNASIQWNSPSEAFSVRLWGRNLGQEKYYAYAGNSAASNMKYSAAPPRTYGVTLSAHY